MVRVPGIRAGVAAAVAAMAVAVAAPVAGGAIVPVAPVAGSMVSPLGAFEVRLTEGEHSPTILLYRSLDDAAADDAAGVGALRGTTVPTLRREGAGGSTILRAYEPIAPGRWFWRASATAPRGSTGESFPRSVLTQITVPRIVSMTQARFARSGARVTASYAWRTNSPRLIHRTEVFYNGTRVRLTQSRIDHSPSRRMAGQRFTASAALTRNRPPFGRIHPGTWVVRVTITDGTRSAAAARRYLIR